MLNGRSVLLREGRSFGNAFTKTVLATPRIRRVVIYSDELKQFEMACIFLYAEYRAIRLIGDSRDSDRLKRALAQNVSRYRSPHAS